MADWPTLALWWYGGPGAVPRAARTDDRSDLRPAARVLSVHAAGVAAGHRLADDARRPRRARSRRSSSWSPAARGCRRGRRTRARPRRWRGLALAWAAVLLALAAQVYLGRFERLFDDHTIFAGVTYTDAHVTLTGMLVVVGRARARRAGRARSTRSSAPRVRWLVAAAAAGRGRVLRRPASSART